MADNELERIYTIPLREVKHGSRNKMTNRAVREVRSFLTRHMKSDDIWIDDAVNRAIWARGMYTVPSKIRVRAVKFEDGVVEVSLPEEEASTSIRQQLATERESKAPILPVAEAEEEEEEETEAGEIEAEPELREGQTTEERGAPEPEDAGTDKPQTGAETKDEKVPKDAEKGKPPVSAKDTRTKSGDES